MTNHGNAVPAQYPEFAGMVQHKLWPALKDRLDEDGYKALIAKPNDVMKRLRDAFTKEGESGIIVPTSPFFANEEVPSNYGYPEGYAVKPVCEQLVELSKHFPKLDSSGVLACSKDLPSLPQGAEGPYPYVIPQWWKVASTYNEALEKVLDLIGTTRPFYNHRKGALGQKYLCQSERTMVAEQMIAEKQKGDFMLLGAQFGLTHRGRSTRRVRVIYAGNEFGLGAFAVGSMLLAHPERLVQWEQLHIDCPGDEYAPGAGGRFSRAPLFGWDDGGVEFDANGVDVAYADFGSASAFLPQ